MFVNIMYFLAVPLSRDQIPIVLDAVKTISERQGHQKSSFQMQVKNPNLFPEKGLLYYTSLESDYEGHVLVLKRVSLQHFITYLNDCICSL